MTAPGMPPLPEMHDDESLLMGADELRRLQADAARAALEQAAKVCDDQADKERTSIGSSRALFCADAIRALAKEITLGPTAQVLENSPFSGELTSSARIKPM